MKEGPGLYRLYNADGSYQDFTKEERVARIAARIEEGWLEVPPGPSGAAISDEPGLDNVSEPGPKKRGRPRKE